MSNNFILKFDAFIFDFDGVILDSEPIHYEACCHALKRIGLFLPYQEYQNEYIGLSDKEMFPRLLHHKGFKLSLNDIHHLIIEKVDHYNHLIDSYEYLPIVSNVDIVIEAIAKKGKKIAICSGSTKREISNTLNRLKQGSLQPYFNIIVTSEDVLQGKPSPEGYLLTAKRLDVLPHQCLVIEDTPTGIKAGKDAGMTVVAVQTTYDRNQLHEADHIVDHLGQLHQN